MSQPACQTGDGKRARVGHCNVGGRGAAGELHDSRLLVRQHFRGSDAFVLLDNESDLISAMPQVLLGCELVR